MQWGIGILQRQRGPDRGGGEAGLGGCREELKTEAIPPVWGGVEYCLVFSGIPAKTSILVPKSRGRDIPDMHMLGPGTWDPLLQLLHLCKRLLEQQNTKKQITVYMLAVGANYEQQDTK